MQHSLLLLLFLIALSSPALRAQCDAEVPTCDITIQMTDGFGDGWYDQNDNPCSIEVYQGTTLRGTATLVAGFSGTVTVAVCPADSVRFVWIGSDDYNEIGFSLFNGADSLIVHVASGVPYSNGQSIAVIAPACAVAPVPQPCAIDSLPYYCDFEQDQPYNCWQFHTNGDGDYPRLSTNYSHSGSQSLYFYANSSVYSYALLPPISIHNSLITNHNSLVLSFWSRSSSSEYPGTLKVGFMTDSADLSTFVPLATCTPNGTQWTYHEVPIILDSQFTVPGDSVARFAILNEAGASNYVYVDDVTLTEMPSCSSVRDLVVGPVTTSYARLHWRPGVAIGYYGAMLEYRPIGGNAPWISVTTADTSVVLAGLTAATDYEVKVTAICIDSASSVEPLTTSLRTPAFGCAQIDSASIHEVLLADANPGSNYTLPLNNYYGYSVTQQLILASELASTASTLNAISFQYSSPMPMMAKNDVSIYLAHTQQNYMGRDTMLDIAAMTKVYSGNMNCSQGWNSFDFNIASFAYDGVSNLVVCIVDNSGSYDGSPYTFATHGANSMACALFSDDYSYASGYSSMTTGANYSYRANMKLSFGNCEALSTCAAPAPYVVALTSDSVSVAWLPGAAETSWNLYVEVDGIRTFLTTVNNSQFTIDNSQFTIHNSQFTNLIPDADYTFYVENVCGGDTFTGSVAFHVPDDTGRCHRPVAVVVDSVGATWVALHWSHNTADTFLIEWYASSPACGLPTIQQFTNHDSLITIHNLLPSTQYTFRIYAVCGEGDTSAAAYAQALTADHVVVQEPAMVPYFYDFENAYEWANWQTCSNTSANWFRGTAAAVAGGFPAGSNYSMYVSRTDGATYKPYPFNTVVNAAAWRDIDFGLEERTYQLSFKARAGGNIQGAYDGLMVFVVDTTSPVVASDNLITSPWGSVNSLHPISSVRVDTVWRTYTASIDTVSGVRRLAFFWFNQPTEDGSFANHLMEPAAVDDILIETCLCPRPLSVTVNNIGATTATVSWPSQADYEVTIQQYNGTQATTIQQFTIHNSQFTFNNLTPLTRYVVTVRKICGTDTSLSSDPVYFTTVVCDDGSDALNYNSTIQQSAQSTNSPIGYSYLGYSYVQTIIPAAILNQQFNNSTININAIGFNPVTSLGGDCFHNVTVWLSNVSDDRFADGFISPDAQHQFRKVIDNADFSYSHAGWQLHQFDDAFVWDGTSNVLVTVSRANEAWGIGSTFAAHNDTILRTCYRHRDSIAFTPDNAEGGTMSNTVGDIMLVSCGDYCPPPTALTVSDITQSSAVAHWQHNSADSFELSVRRVGEDWPDPFTIHNSQFTIHNLQPNEQYQFRVRALCDEWNTSEWSAPYTFTTLPQVGIDEFTIHNSQFTIFPNPTTGKVTISIQNSKFKIQNSQLTVSIVDLNGRILRTQTIHPSSFTIHNSQFTIHNLDGLAPGSYFVRITGQGINTVHKLIVK